MYNGDDGVAGQGEQMPRLRLVHGSAWRRSTSRVVVSERGFTLLELIVTLAVAAIVLTIAVPSFQGLIESDRSTSRANDLVRTLNLARSEAITRSADVTVAAINASTGFSGGWCVSTGDDCAAGVIHTFSAPTGTAVTVSGDATAFIYNARGFKSDMTQVTINIEPTNCASSASKETQVLTINVIGQPMVTQKEC